jgi:hypothetical protein
MQAAKKGLEVVVKWSIVEFTTIFYETDVTYLLTSLQVLPQQRNIRASRETLMVLLQKQHLILREIKAISVRWKSEQKIQTSKNLQNYP